MEDIRDTRPWFWILIVGVLMVVTDRFVKLSRVV